MKTTIKIRRTEKEMEMALRNKERKTCISASVPKKRMNRNRWEVLQNFNSRTKKSFEFDLRNFYKSKFRADRVEGRIRDEQLREGYRRSFISYVNKHGLDLSRNIFNKSMGYILTDLFGDWEILYGYGSDEAFERREVKETENGILVEIEYGSTGRYRERKERKGWIGTVGNIYNNFSYPYKLSEIVIRNNKTKEKEVVKLSKGAYNHSWIGQIMELQELPQMKKQIRKSDNKVLTFNKIVREKIKYDFRKSEDTKSKMIENLKHYLRETHKIII